MFYVLAFLVGVVVGGICMFVILLERHSRVKAREAHADLVAKQAAETMEGIKTRQLELTRREFEIDTQGRELKRRVIEEMNVRQLALTHREVEIEADGKEFKRRIIEEMSARQSELSRRELEIHAQGKEFKERVIAEMNSERRELDVHAQKLRDRQTEIDRQVKELNDRIISYAQYQRENAILKRDLQNVAVALDKLTLDGELLEQKQKQLDERSNEMAERYLNETIKSVVAAIGPNNFSACKQRLVDAIARCRNIGFPIPNDEETRLLSNLKSEFEKEVRAAFAREEQARIKAQIREEERLKRDAERELKQLERERAAIQAALDQALADAKGQHNAEVERLQARLAEAEEKSRRTISMAEQTKAGHVYVISNIGTFGDGIFKVGMTRRLEPQERVDELGCASVPFPFDVHMMISCENAPTLENAIHRALYKQRINRANPRKEFFRARLDQIVEIVRRNHGEIQYVAEPEALQYRQSLTMPEEDASYVESVYDAAFDDQEMPTDP
jgi:hypothetical protein